MKLFCFLPQLKRKYTAMAGRIRASHRVEELYREDNPFTDTELGEY